MIIDYVLYIHYNVLKLCYKFRFYILYYILYFYIYYYILNKYEYKLHIIYMKKLLENN